MIGPNKKSEHYYPNGWQCFFLLKPDPDYVRRLGRGVILISPELQLILARDAWLPF